MLDMKYIKKSGKDANVGNQLLQCLEYVKERGTTFY